MAEQLDDRYRLHVVQVNGFAGFAAGANAQGPVSAPVAEEITRRSDSLAEEVVELAGCGA